IVMQQENKHIVPKVTLVGAGPGDPDLITLKGMKAIREADVILYDALINQELLSYAKASSTIIYVGKRAERISTSQDYINKLLVYCAFSYCQVVRFKGSDLYGYDVER